MKSDTKTKPQPFDVKEYVECVRQSYRTMQTLNVFNDGNEIVIHDDLGPVSFQFSIPIDEIDACRGPELCFKLARKLEPRQLDAFFTAALKYIEYYKRKAEAKASRPAKVGVR